MKQFKTFDERGLLNVVTDTPKGSRNKLAWSEEHGMYELRHVLAAGMAFPFDFGFLPGTETGDGDPLDVLVLMDEPTYPGTLVRSRLIGILECEQKEGGKTERNDRLVAVADASRAYTAVEHLDNLNPTLLHDIEQFFVAYNAARGKEFRIIGRGGPQRARELVKQGSPRE